VAVAARSRLDPDASQDTDPVLLALADLSSLTMHLCSLVSTLIEATCTPKVRIPMRDEDGEITHVVEQMTTMAPGPSAGESY
jgi:hypothetical protein